MSIEMSLFWAAVAMYGIAAFGYIFGFVSEKEKMISAGIISAYAGIGLHIGAVAVRWIEGGVLPFIEISESLTSGVLVAMLIFLIGQIINPRIRDAGILVMPVAFTLLGWAGTLAKRVGGDLPASLQSYWLWVHIVAASSGFGSVLVAAGLGLLFLLKGDRTEGMYGKIPELPYLDNLEYRFIAAGFVMLGLMLVSGAFWSHQVHGTYWNWDPVEVWSLVSWLVYGIYLHLRRTFGWRDRKLAWYALLALVVMIVSYWGIPFVAQNFHSGFRIEH